MIWEVTNFPNKMKYIRPLFDLFVFFAIIHLLIALILVLQNLDLSYFNVFYVTSVSMIFPGIEKGMLSGVVSIIIVGSVYLYFYSRRKARQ